MRPDHAREIRLRLADPDRLCLALGLEVGRQRQAHGVIVRCPWHDDEHPSCSVRVAGDGTIAVHCHACGASGDALSLVAAVRGLDVRLDFRAVLQEAADLSGYDLGDGKPVRSARRRAPEIDLALRIANASEAWLAGRTVRDDPAIERATQAEIVGAMSDLAEAAAIVRESDDALDAVLDARADEWAAREAAHLEALCR